MTAIFVTHDQEEAMGVSDRIAVMNAGKIEQFATPSELYARPRSSFVMDFVGLSTRLRGQVRKTDGTTMQIETANGLVLAKGELGVGSDVTVGVRPELILPGAGENTISVTLADAMVLGAKTQLHGVSHAEDRLLCEVPGIQTTLTRGQDVTFGWSVKDTLVYEAHR